MNTLWESEEIGAWNCARMAGTMGGRNESDHNDTPEAQGSKYHYKTGDSKCHSRACGSKCELNHSIVRPRARNAIAKQVTQNGILGHVV
jgi:hypothetical protein